MAKDYWFPFTPAKWREHTMHLTLEQEAIYLRLTIHYMETGASLPDNDVALARIAGVSLETFRLSADVLKKFYRKSGEKLEHVFCEGILADQAERKQSYSDRKRGKFKKSDIKKPSKIKDEKSTENQNDISRSVTEHNSTVHVLLEKEPKGRKVTIPKPADVSQETFDDFVGQRKTKFTNTALKGMRREVAKAGIPLEDGMRIATERGWQTFKSKWDWKEDHETTRTNHNGSNGKSRRAREVIAEALTESLERDRQENFSGGSVESNRLLPELR